MASSALCLSASVVGLGLARGLLPLLFLQPHLVAAQSLSAHLVHHLSAILGTALCPLVVKRFPAHLLLTSVWKALCLLAMACFPPLLALPFPLPLCLFPVPIFAIGVSDGILRRALLERMASRGNSKSDGNRRMEGVLSFLLCSSLGPFIAALLSDVDPSVPPGPSPQFQFDLCHLPLRFSVPLPVLFVATALFQLFLLFPLRSLPQNEEHSEEEENEVPDDRRHHLFSPDQLKRALSRNQTKSSAALPTPSGWRLTVPLCLLSALPAALALQFPYALFGFSSAQWAQAAQERVHLVVFAASALLTNLLLALLPSSPSRLSPLLSPNVLFPAGLFGSGLAFCTLNVPFARLMAVALCGASLALFSPAVLSHWADPPNENDRPSLSALLISLELGPLLFPFVFTQILSTDGGPQLFSSVALLCVLSMVVAFVCLLNVQAEAESKRKRGGQFWGFWRGGRTRSIRRFVRNVRSSLRSRPPGKRRGCGRSSALLEESSVATRSNYHSIHQGLSECGPRSRVDTAVEILSPGQQFSPPPQELKRQFSLPSIVLDAGTPKMSFAEQGERGEEGR